MTEPNPAYHNCPGEYHDGYGDVVAAEHDASVLRAALKRLLDWREFYTDAEWRQKHDLADSDPWNNARALLAALPPNAPPALNVERLARAFTICVETLNEITELSDATEQSSFREEAWAALDNADVAAEYARLEQDR